jgi:hypothetical protein
VSFVWVVSDFIRVRLSCSVRACVCACLRNKGPMHKQSHHHHGMPWFTHRKTRELLVLSPAWHMLTRKYGSACPSKRQRSRPHEIRVGVLTPMLTVPAAERLSASDPDIVPRNCSGCLPAGSCRVTMLRSLEVDASPHRNITH